MNGLLIVILYFLGTCFAVVGLLNLNIMSLILAFGLMNLANLLYMKGLDNNNG
jgi:hypothetical protein